MSKLAQMQARFQQKQLQEKEEKLLRMYETQQQRAIERVGRSSAGSNLSNTLPVGKVRQMFEERRQKAGIDRSYPLQPLKNNRANGQQPLARAGSLDRLSKNKVTTSSVQQTQRSTIQRNVTQVRNGKTTVAKTNGISTTRKVATYQRIYNNNEEDENDNQQLEALMNNHNLNGSIEDEEFPDVGFDETDSQGPYNYLVTGKLPNVGGKHPSELIQGGEGGGGVGPPATNARNDNRAVRANGVLPNKYNPPMRKEAHQPPVIKQTVTKQPPVRKPPISNSRNSPAKSNSTLQSYADFEMDKRPVKQQSAAPEAVRSAKPPPPRPPTRTPPSNVKSAGQSGVARDDLTGCRFCSRRFASDRLKTHENICGKTAHKKRKQYDPVKHRVQGTELEPFVKGSRPTKSGKQIRNSSSNEPKLLAHNSHQSLDDNRKSGISTLASAKSANKKSDWRKKHEDFIATIRAAKLTQQHLAKGGKLKDLPPPPPSYNPDYIQCPHCGRRFNETAAERHIPKCATMIHNKPNRLGPAPTAASATAAKKRY